MRRRQRLAAESRLTNRLQVAYGRDGKVEQIYVGPPDELAIIVEEFSPKTGYSRQEVYDLPIDEPRPKRAARESRKKLND